MILDHLYNSNLYEAAHPGLKKAFSFLQMFAQKPLPPGRYEIDGNRVFATVMHYDTEDETALRWECHRRYIDVQYIHAGEEHIYWTNEKDASGFGTYDEEQDVCFVQKLTGTPLPFRAGDFMVLFPEDIHKPKCRIGVPLAVKKVVVKVEL